MWWCPTCKNEVSGTQVTFEEYHDVCGTYLGDCQELSEEEKINSAVQCLIDKGLTPEDYKKAWNIFYKNIGI